MGTLHAYQTFAVINNIVANTLETHDLSQSDEPKNLLDQGAKQNRSKQLKKIPEGGSVLSTG